MHLPIIRRPAPEGQVLLLGIVIMLVLLLAILFLFDIHNVIRAKFKTETAQPAAALAAANWQKESLNLIGEINLIKAAETLLQDEGRWVDVPQLEPDPVTGEPSPYPLKPRIDLLTEMQTRISFIGPLIGFAAAQHQLRIVAGPRIPVIVPDAAGVPFGHVELCRVALRIDGGDGGLVARTARNADGRHPGRPARDCRPVAERHPLAAVIGGVVAEDFGHDPRVDLKQREKEEKHDAEHHHGFEHGSSAPAASVHVFLLREARISAPSCSLRFRHGGAGCRA